MKKIAVLLLCCIVAISFFLNGCIVVNTNPFSVSGRGTKEKYDIAIASDGFTEINVKSFCEVNFHISDKYSVTLEVEPNLREYFTVEVRGGALTVESKESINYGIGRSPILTVYAPQLTRLSVEGACSFTGHDKIKADKFYLAVSGAGSGEIELDADKVYVNLEGAGSFKLKGAADSIEINLAGAGEIDAIGLKAREADVRMSGAGSVRVNCDETLKIDAEGAGSLEYKGSPKTDIRNKGVVSIEKV